MTIPMPWDIEPLSWEDRWDLPRASGIYFIMSGEKAVFYVGLASCLRSRVTCHHKKFWFERLYKPHISYVFCDHRSLRSVEQFYIELLNPCMNGRGWQNDRRMLENLELTRSLDQKTRRFEESIRSNSEQGFRVTTMRDQICTYRDVEHRLDETFTYQMFRVFELEKSVR